jgi:hypothetical protein
MYIFEYEDVHYDLYNIDFCAGGIALYLVTIELYLLRFVVYVYVYFLHLVIYICTFRLICYTYIQAT